MGIGFYKKLREILLANGCYLHRQGKGSHEVWKSPINGETFPVPVKILKKPTANGILKQAGIDRKI